MKTEMDIEKLLQWAYRDELSKKTTSSAEGIWDRIEDFGQRGGIDPGHGAAQRYPHFGLPDPDAEAIERAVGQLEDVIVDWAKSIDAIAGNLAGLVSINDFTRRPDGAPGRTTTVGWTDRRTGKWRQVENRPRDMLMVQTFRPRVLITTHAVQGSRPDWWDEQPRPYMIRATKGPNAKIEGECKDKNRYSIGSYCPLQWEPSPVSVITARAEYAVWWEALHKLVETIHLAHHIALPPRAPAQPWFGEVEDRNVIHVPPDGPIRHLPLAPTRGRMLAPFRRSPAGPVRYPLETSGDQ